MRRWNPARLGAALAVAEGAGRLARPPEGAGFNLFYADEEADAEARVATLVKVLPPAATLVLQ